MPADAAPSPITTPEEVGEGEIVRVNTTLVTVPASVMDRNGRYVPDLGKADFRVFENGVEQAIAFFAAVEKPFTVVLMLDTSSSTWSKLGEIKDAAIAFVDQLRPDDQVMVVSFARGLTIKNEATSDRQKIRKAIESTGRGLSTHLYDAMDKMMRKQINLVQGRKAIVLFTDGVDATSNDATYESTVHIAEELDALIYPILYDTYDPKADTGGPTAPSPPFRLPGILRKIPFPFPLPIPTQGGGSSSGPGSSRADYDRGERYLHELADLTGGRVYEARKDLSYLRIAFTDIADELRRQYSLGYYPSQAGRKGERRRIKVLVNRPELVVRARGSYIYQPAAAVPTTTSDAAKDGESHPTPPVLQKKPFAGSEL
jgi:VWFA-related protein